MRVPLLLSALAFASVATAQTTFGANEVSIQQAMQSLRDANPLMLEMRGTDTFGTATTNVHAILYWRTSYDSRTGKDSKAEVELDVYTPTPTGEQISLRIVGDGVNLRRYDVVRRTVSTTTYGFYGSIVPANHPDSDAPALLRQLRAVTPGPAAYLARLVSDLLPAGSAYAATYSGWMPGYRSRTLMEIPSTEEGGRRHLNAVEISEDDTVTDPITGATYIQGAAGWVTYGVESSNPLRTLAFALDTSESGTGTTIKTVYFADRTAGRLLKVAITPNSSPTLPTYAFIPYSGAASAAFLPIVQPG